MLWFLVAICLSYQASAECPQLSTPFVAELAKDYITCYETTTSLAAETAHDYCQCLATFMNGLGGWDCSLQIGTWGLSIGSAAFIPAFNQIITDRQIGSNIFRTFFGSNNPFLANVANSVGSGFSSTSVGSIGFGSIGSTFGFASLGSATLGGLGDQWPTTCADETGWDFVAWLKMYSQAIGYRFTSSRIWEYSPIVNSVSFKSVTDNNVALTVGWDTTATTADKDAFVDSLTFWCWSMLKTNWNILLRRGSIGCFATWEDSTINFEIGTNGDVIPSPKASTFHVSIQLPTGVTCGDSAYINTILNPFKNMAKPTTLTATCDGTAVTIAKRNALQTTSVLDVAGQQANIDSTSDIYYPIEVAETTGATILEASLATTGTWADEMSTYSGYTNSDSGSPSTILISNAVWVVLLICGFVAM